MLRAFWRYPKHITCIILQQGKDRGIGVMPMSQTETTEG